MNKSPLVSIITPCYNSESYLHRYIDSAISQTYDNIELIFVNDGSKDNTKQVIFSYKEKIEARGYKFVYVEQENQGIGGAIDNGLKSISGEYFAWCDSDNFYSKDYVKEKVDYFLSHPEYSIVRCDGYVVYENDIHTSVRKMADGNTDLYCEHLFENCIDERNFHFGCAMIRTADFDKVNPTRDIYPSREGQNWQLLLPMFYHFKSAYVDKPMFYFVHRQDSVSNITSTQSIEKLIAQKNEYEKIIKTTVKSMGIPDESKYIDRVETKFSRVRLGIYAQSRMKSEMKAEYEKLKNRNAVDRATKITYLKGKYGILNAISNILYKIKKRKK